MNCPFCSSQITENDKRCSKCGKSLIKVVTNGASDPNEQPLPYYMQTADQQKRTMLIVNILIKVICAVVIGILGLFIIFRLNPTAFTKTNPNDIKIVATTYEVEPIDSEYASKRIRSYKIKIPFTIINESKRPIKKLSAKVYANSKDILLWSIGDEKDGYVFIKPGSPLGPNESRDVIIEFPVNENPPMSAIIKWNYDILVLKQ